MEVRNTPLKKNDKVREIQPGLILIFLYERVEH